MARVCVQCAQGHSFAFLPAVLVCWCRRGRGRRRERHSNSVNMCHANRILGSVHLPSTRHKFNVYFPPSPWSSTYRTLSISQPVAWNPAVDENSDPVGTSRHLTSASELRDLCCFRGVNMVLRCSDYPPDVVSHGGTKTQLALIKLLYSDKLHRGWKEGRERETLWVLNWGKLLYPPLK